MTPTAPAWYAFRPRAVWLALAALLAAPAPALGRCGDYVHLAGDPARPASPAPCRGPHCSRPQAPPLLPPTALTRPHLPSDALQSAGRAGAERHPPLPRPEDAPAPPAAATLSGIFRPPR